MVKSLLHLTCASYVYKWFQESCIKVKRSYKSYAMMITKYVCFENIFQSSNHMIVPSKLNCPPDLVACSMLLATLTWQHRGCQLLVFHPMTVQSKMVRLLRKETSWSLFRDPWSTTCHDFWECWWPFDFYTSSFFVALDFQTNINYKQEDLLQLLAILNSTKGRRHLRSTEILTLGEI